MDYFRDRRVSGLDATIDCLGKSDRSVRLYYVQLEKAIVVLWVEEQSKAICGLLVIESAE